MSSTAFAGEWSSYATPTKINIVRGEGIMVWGYFGNPGSCVTSNTFFVESNHPQYKEIYSAILMVFKDNKKVQTYIHSCAPVEWLTTSSTTWNIMSSNSALNLSN